MSEIERSILIAPQERGWAVITTYHSGRWEGFTSTFFCRWYWQARREYDRAARNVVR